VRAFRNETDECRFVAFFLPDFDHFVTQGELRRYAREQLVEELVPQQWVELDEFAVDAHGAIDRKILLDPLAPRDNYLAPRTTVEKGLARIWHDALGVERVGLGDNFFDLGGHSLLSTRVIVQIYKKFGVRLDQATMVLHTLEQVSRAISEQTGGDADASAIENIAPVKAESAQSTGAFTDKKITNKKKSILKSWLDGKR
jgi:acyl carrier protein